VVISNAMFGICKEGHRVCLGILEETNEKGVGLVKYCWVVVSFLLSAYAIIADAFLGKSHLAVMEVGVIVLFAASVYVHLNWEI
jgi:hypothetical protein